MLQNCYYSDYIGHGMDYVVSVWVSEILLQQQYLMALWREVYHKPITYDCIISNAFFRLWKSKW